MIENVLKLVMSFRYKTIIGIAVIEALMLGLLVWNALNILTYSSENELIKRAKTTTELFALSNKDAVLSNDIATLESFVTEVLKHPGIVYARVIGRDNKILAQQGDMQILMKPVEIDNTYSDVDDGVFDARAAIEILGGTYGWVEIGFSVDDITAAIADARRKSVTFAGIEMILTAFFSFVLGIYLTRSINRLRIGAQNISAGDLGYQIEVKGNDELAAASAAFNDMSQKLLETEQHLKASLDEKELLLREIHHRASNNMQVISSLINMQMTNIKDRHSTKVLDDCQNIIDSMALVHDRLFTSKDLTNIDLRDYVESLTNTLLSHYGFKRDSLALVVDVKNIRLSIDYAIPCGIIINEIVSNSLKHAFPDKENGEIIISIKMKEDYCFMNIRDNGIGIPKGLNAKGVRSMGMQLITILAEHQLNGTLDINTDNGMEYRITFKDLKNKQRINVDTTL